MTKPNDTVKNVEYYQNLGGEIEHDEAARERNRDAADTEESAKSLMDKVADVAHDAVTKIKRVLR